MNNMAITKLENTSAPITGTIDWVNWNIRYIQLPLILREELEIMKNKKKDPEKNRKDFDELRRKVLKKVQKAKSKILKDLNL